MFIILGRTTQNDAPLFNAAPEPMLVNQAQHTPGAPIRVFANRNGIFLSCPGASLSSRQAELLIGTAAGGTTSAPPSDALTPGNAYSAVPAEIADALGVAGKTTPLVPIPAGTGSPAAVATPSKEGAVDAESKNPEVPSAKRKVPRSRSHLLRQQEEVDLITARLQYLCRLIGRARAPYCPLNGIMLIVPMASTSNDDDAQQMGAVCRRDLATIREVLQIRCPFITVLGGLEKLDGFREFTQRIPRELASQRLGQDFPLMPDLDPDAIRKMIDSGVQWVCKGMVPRAAFRLLKTESSGGTSSEAAAINAHLFRFVQETAERGKRYAQIAVRAAMAEGPALLAGCYLAGTGANQNSEQAFITGCFRLLTENQNYVSWTSQALSEEAEYYRMTRIGYAVTWIMIATMVFLGYFLWPRSY
ncbi:MAG: type VI secretion protein IcmF/TssM N-terminal domain-containing protein [Planctomycetota bacterium]